MDAKEVCECWIKDELVEGKLKNSDNWKIIEIGTQLYNNWEYRKYETPTTWLAKRLKELSRDYFFCPTDYTKGVEEVSKQIINLAYKSNNEDCIFIIINIFKELGLEIEEVPLI